MRALGDTRIQTLGRVLIFLVGLLGLVLVASTLETRSRISQIEVVWQQFEDGRSDKRRVLNELYADLGYGGMIHGFKNYVLRQDSSAVATISSKLGSAQESLARYKALGTNEAEDQALDKITVVLESYATALKTAESLAIQGISPREIDAAVRVDDGPAFRALNALDGLSNYRGSEFRASENNWKLINELRRTLGYGGLIHQFKNYVLRHEPSYRDAVHKDIVQAEEILRRYEDHNPSKAEWVALQSIWAALDHYTTNLEIAQSLVRQGKTPTEIDRVIKIDDRPALKGLATLIREVRAHNAVQAATVDKGLNLVAALSELMIVFTLVASCLIIGLSFWLIRLQIVQPIQHLAGIMRQLAQGNLDIEVPISESRNEIGEITHAVGVFKHNSVERARAEKALREAKNDLERRVEERTTQLRGSRDQLRLVTDNLPVLIAYLDTDLRYRFVNNTGSEWLARPFEEVIGKSIPELYGQEYEKLRSRFDSALAGEQLTFVESVTYPDGVTRTVHVTHVPHMTAAGNVEGYFILAEDISELLQAEQALRKSDERFRAIADHSPSAIFLKDLEGRYIFVNRVWHDMYNPTGGNIIGKTVHDFLPPEVAESMLELEAKVLETGVAIVGEQVVPTAEGGCQNMLSTKFPVRDGDGNIIALGIVNTEITDRVTAEQALRESEERFRGVIENLPAALSLKDLEGRFQLVNPKFAEWFGTQPEEVIGKTAHDIAAQLSDAVFALDRMVIETGRTHELEVELPFADGTVHSLALKKFPVLGPNDEPIGIGTINTDITANRQVEEALRQAQKMEAVGQLTGGVAHDFNNLLAVILGHTELLRDEMGDNPLLATIDRAATRGAELTQRLLTFARQQSLATQSIDLTELVPGLHDILDRTLGEQIEIVTDVSEETWPVLADPGQLENALLNLSINARDAMPGGGVLQIKCKNVQLQDGDARVANDVPEGDYVQITVRDTGVGMPEDIIDHVFEPFYTTKDVGEGSGLGLSMAYGFARQSGGDAVIESEQGAGTEVRIFLPRAGANAASVEPIREQARKRGQGRAVLVLEDDSDVRSLAVAALAGLDYRVLEAADARAAMQILEDEAENIELLLSDVVLPGGVSGPEFAANAKDLYPKMKLVFMSGYANDLYTTDKIPGFDETLLTKPFKRAHLAKVISDTLAA